MEKIEGTLTAIVTPFSKDGKEIDIESLKNFVRFQSGVSGLVAAGSTGEGQVLSDKEFELLLKTVSTESKIPVYAGIGTNSTERAIFLSMLAKDCGVAGLLVVAPPYNKPPQRGILEHYRAIKKATGLPIIAYNIPGRSAVNIATETLATLSSEGTIDAIKESSGSMDQVIDILKAAPKVSLLSGEDSLTTSMMVMGAKGVICTCSNIIPQEMMKLTSAGLNGDFSLARDQQFKILPTIRMLFKDTNPIPVKYCVFRAGLIENPSVRLPLMEPEAKLKEELDKLVSEWF
jgi:4-hydroxy-tetrahydrodipicolinate synthase